jgi:hypothetical protein
MQDYGIPENLYNSVLEGKWTIDVLERLTKDMNQDLNGDGKMNAEDDFYGLITQNNSITMDFFVAGLGVQFSTVKDNMIYVDMNSVLNLSKIDRMADLLVKINYKDQNNILNSTFKESRALFVAHCLESPQVWLRDMEDDYGILPMPKWDEKQETYVSFLNAWGSGFVGIPVNADIEKSAFLTEAMAYAGYEKFRTVVYDITLKTKGARDEESERMIDLILETSYLDLGGVYNFGGKDVWYSDGLQGILLSALIDKKPFVSAYEKIENAIQKDIEKFIETMSND